jgi:tetratricopeptide (TPR) repeat protein
MMESYSCPQCRQPLTNVGEFWVCPQHGQINIEKTFAALRIFLSYGHDRNEELVLRIKADLEKRKHDVWVDKNKIKVGDDWRLEITEGILDSNQVVSFLSKHSTRDPGVCLDEIAIALGVKGGNIQTILVESETEVNPPNSISHIQWLDMHDWKEGHGIVKDTKFQPATGDAVWEQWYQAKLSEIIEVVESEESRRFAGEIEALNVYLKPIRSEVRICQLLNKGFYGRKWLFEAVERWRQDTTQDSRLFWIMGAPGVGKSAFAAKLTHMRGDTVIAAQFCEWDKPDHKNAQRVIRSIAFQIATRLPDFRKLLLLLPEIGNLDQKKATELFDYLIVNPMRLGINGGRERYLIVIDALDEAREGFHNPLADILAQNAKNLPDWIRIVITSRPEKDVVNPLQDLKPFIFDTETEENCADIRNYLYSKLSTMLDGRPDANAIIENILRKSEGVFLYVEHICRNLENGYLSIDNVDAFPQGLGQVFREFFIRHFPLSKESFYTADVDYVFYKQNCIPFLELVIAAHEPLQQIFISSILGIRSYEYKNIIDAFGSLLRTTDDRIRLSHKSLIDWLCDSKKAGEYWIDHIEGHKCLSEAGMKEFHKGVCGMDPYFKEHLPVHLAYASDWHNLIILINSSELNLIDRWTSKGYQYEGLVCLQGLVKYLINQSNQASFTAGLLTQIAGILSSLGKYSEAEAELLKAQNLSDDRRISSIALHELGSLRLYRGELSCAYETYDKALNLCLKEDPMIADEAAANLLGLASIRLLQYKYEDVYTLASDALQKAKGAGDVPHTIAANRILATAYKDNLKFENAEEHLRMADLLAEFSDLSLEKVATSHLRAWVEYTRCILNNNFKIDTSIDIFKQTIKIAKLYSYIPYKISAKLGLARCALTQYEDKSAHDLLIEIEQEITSESSYDLIIGTKLLRASITHQQGNFDLANTQYKEARDSCKKYIQKARESDAWQGLGSTYWYNGNKGEAESCWQQAKLISDQCCPARSRLILIGIERSHSNPRSTPL